MIACLCANISDGVPENVGGKFLRIFSKPELLESSGARGVGVGDGVSSDNGIGVTVTLSSSYGAGDSPNSLVCKSILVLKI